MKRILFVALLAGAALRPLPAFADHVVRVDCAGATPGAFASIGAALAATPPDMPRTILVSGACHEFVDVVGRRNLTIEGQPGAAIVPPGSPPPRIAMLIRDSSRIVLRGLTVRGESIRVQDATADFDRVTVEQSPRSGVVVAGPSFLWIVNSRLLDNAGDGLMVIEGAAARLSQLESRGNGNGIAVNTGDVQLLGDVTLEGNRSSGLFVRAGRVRMDARPGPILIRSNGTGVHATGTSSIHMIGNILVARNTGFGIQAALGTSLDLQGAGSADDPGRTIVEENGSVGINLAGSASANISGSHVIRNNGRTSGPDAGLRVGSTSRVQFSGPAEISGNSGPGVLAEWNASVFLGTASIVGNGHEGARVLRNSVLMLGGNVAGNAGGSVTCDTTGLVVLETTAIAGVRCARVEREHGPPRPGRIR